MTKDMYIDLRNKFKKIVKRDHSSGICIVMSGAEIRRSQDSVYPFHTNRNFFYLTGIEEPEAVYIWDIKNNDEILFIRDIDPFMEKWVGHYMTKEEALLTSGIEDIRYLSNFDRYFEEQITSEKKILLDFDQDNLTDQRHTSAESMRISLDTLEQVDLFPYLRESRMIKHDMEIQLIKEAVEITHQSISEMLKEIKFGANERDLAARFLYEGQKRGGELMFDTIVASGKNACVLHYIENDQDLVNGELVLVDLGIEKNGYGADISRTYPINGKFTERQKQVYQEVLNCFHIINEKAKPGISLKELDDLAVEELSKSVKNLKLKGSVEDYYYHSIGHSLGLDTHDVWPDKNEPLKPGNVITNEPGLYIAEEGIGIRLETDLLITNVGSENLASQIPIEIEEIENLFK